MCDVTLAMLFDMDGVLVENVKFELGVTDYIIRQLASSDGGTIHDAALTWDRELADSKGHPDWYSYDFHCRRLNIADLGLAAHREAETLLARVPGVEGTLDLVLQSNIEFGIASDAMSWVVDFKLNALGLPRPDFVISSDITGVPKKSKYYWTKLAHAYGTDKTFIYVDNRTSNLITAQAALGERVKPIYFAAEEHVLQLTEVHVDHDVAHLAVLGIPIVMNHSELTALLAKLLK